MRRFNLDEDVPQEALHWVDFLDEKDRLLGGPAKLAPIPKKGEIHITRKGERREITCVTVYANGVSVKTRHAPSFPEHWKDSSVILAALDVARKTVWWETVNARIDEAIRVEITMATQKTGAKWTNDTQRDTYLAEILKGNV